VEERTMEERMMLVKMTLNVDYNFTHHIFDLSAFSNKLKSHLFDLPIEIFVYYLVTLLYGKSKISTLEYLNLMLGK
jgi:hypothetical protein